MRDKIWAIVIVVVALAMSFLCTWFFAWYDKTDYSGARGIVTFILTSLIASPCWFMIEVSAILCFASNPTDKPHSENS